MKYVCSDTKDLCLFRPLYRKGYTLIEVIVATAIFSAMVLLATMALNQGLSQYRGLMDKGVNFWETARHLWMNRSISSMADYYVSDSKGNWFPYFRGTESMISYVSLAPIAGDLPVAVWITREKMEDGRYALIYRELPVYARGWNELERDYGREDYKKGQSLIVMDGLDDLKFRFYGYYYAKQKEEWSDEYEGRTLFRLPIFVEIDYVYQGKKGTLFFGMRSNSNRKVYYDEAY